MTHLCLAPGLSLGMRGRQASFPMDWHYKDLVWPETFALHLGKFECLEDGQLLIYDY